MKHFIPRSVKIPCQAYSWQNTSNAGAKLETFGETHQRSMTNATAAPTHSWRQCLTGKTTHRICMKWHSEEGRRKRRRRGWAVGEERRERRYCTRVGKACGCYLISVCHDACYLRLLYYKLSLRSFMRSLVSGFARIYYHFHTVWCLAFCSVSDAMNLLHHMYIV